MKAQQHPWWTRPPGTLFWPRQWLRPANSGRYMIELSGEEVEQLAQGHHGRAQDANTAEAAEYHSARHDYLRRVLGLPGAGGEDMPSELPVGVWVRILPGCGLFSPCIEETPGRNVAGCATPGMVLRVPAEVAAMVSSGQAETGTMVFKPTFPTARDL